ncbi:hypothetical protein SR858_12725 [Duganella zoogloeoides]|uniref:Uncharacterized protein n=1 Tax=Duganella zoogloeoides TaxID=75659 RepID=A0ABZ0Y517_9BURK|nr:hypothetical protein [Duganella zoogloeoides]WQH07156.1 hypothetical protein SR858_12725 [Duganella zoogloeoides]
MWSKIASAVAIPIVLAVVGWVVQDSISSESIKKDYVTLAIGMLQDEKVKDPELRAWALSIVRQNSPVPLSSQLQGKIILGAMQAASPVPWPPMPDFAMKPPAKLQDFPLEKIKRGELDNYDLAKGWADAHIAASSTAITLTSLQELVRVRDKLQAEVREKTLARESKSIADEAKK